MDKVVHIPIIHLNNHLYGGILGFELTYQAPGIVRMIRITDFRQTPALAEFLRFYAEDISKMINKNA